MERREFLKNIGIISGLGSVSLAIGSTPIRAFADTVLKNAAVDGKVLVLLQLSGGNDGLNTVIPIEDDIYYQKRPQIAIRKRDAFNLDGLTGLHPSMSAFHELYQEGKLSIVQNVGYPSQNRSHFRSTDIWLSASESDEYITDGWIGRYLGNSVVGDSTYNMDHPMAIQLGSTQSSLLKCTCQGGSMGVSFEDPNQFYQLIEGSSADTDAPPDTIAGNQLRYIKEIAARSIKYAEIIKEKADTVQNKVNYPNSNLADQLAIVAELVAGGMETPVYLTSMGGFDTHSNQLGRHASLLNTLSEAVGAFQLDLERLGVADRVVLMTFSEFGRTVEQNGSAGTDHGSAAPLFVIGRGVNGGIFGGNPDLKDLDRSGDNKYKIDFRQVYSSLLRDQLGVNPGLMNDIMFKSFDPLPLISVKNISSGGPGSFDIKQNYPNPFNPTTRIDYTLRLPQSFALKIYDANGSLVKILDKGYKDAGEYTAYFDARGYASGVYYANLESGTYRRTIKMLLLK